MRTKEESGESQPRRIATAPEREAFLLLHELPRPAYPCVLRHVDNPRIRLP